MAVVAFMSLLSPCLADAHTSDDVHYTHAPNPYIPKSVKFCDKEVDLSRYDMYERMDRELTSIVYTHANTLLTIKRANKYYADIMAIFKKNSIPEDLFYLAAVESYFNPTAISGAKAAGLWQFMPQTGMRFGLEVGNDVDERYDPIKSTQAVCKCLKYLYGKFGDWALVASAYNAGEGRISRELSSQQVDSFYDLYLNQETSRYVFRILAMKLIIGNPKAYGFVLDEDQLYQPIETRSLKVSDSNINWCEWAIAQGINYAILKELNPWIRSKTLSNDSGKTYVVKLPADDKSLYRSAGSLKAHNPKWKK